MTSYGAVHKSKLTLGIIILSMLIVAGGGTATYFAIKANRGGSSTDTSEIYIDPSIKSNFDISELKDVSNGKQVNLTSKNVDKIINTVTVSIGNDLLKANEEYECKINKTVSSNKKLTNNDVNNNEEEKSNCTITIFTKALSSHSGKININPILIDKTYNVTFDSNGGTSVDTQKIKKGEKALEPNSTKYGYILKGWYEKYSSVPFDFKNTSITSDLALTAYWEEKVEPVTKYTVTFAINKTKAYLTQEVEEGKYASKPTDPSVEGKTFNFWYLKGEEGRPFDFNNTPITSNITLYADFTDITCKVTFDTNGAEQSIDPVEVSYGKTVNAPRVRLTKEGHTFSKWVNKNGIQYDFASPVYSNITLIASWDAAEFNVTFDTNGGSYIAPQIVPYNGHAAIPSETPTKQGYTFEKWTDVDGNVFDFDNTPITTDTTIYAAYTKQKFTISFNTDTEEQTIDPVEVEYGNTLTPPTTKLTKTGYKFSKWLNPNGVAYDFSTPVYSDFELKAEWNINKYEVSFDTKGGSHINTQTVEHNSYATEPSTPPTKTGCTFVEWRDSNDAKFDFANTPITADITIHAYYTDNTFTITFNTNGAEEEISPVEVTYGNKVTKPTDTLT